MPKCGVCGDNYGDLITKHAYVCEDDQKAPAQGYSPEIDDLLINKEESK